MIAAAPLRRGRPNLAVLAAAAGAVFAVLVAGAVVTERRDAPPTAHAVKAPSPRDLQAALAWADAVAEPTHAAGFAIIMGIRPDIPDFRSGHISAEVWKTDMETRASEFSSAWAAFDAVPAPKALGSAPKAFDQAFADYLLAARALWEAGTVEGADREALISMGAQVGDLGDRAFDRGAATLQRIRRAAGMEPDPRFPDKEHR